MEGTAKVGDEKANNDMKPIDKSELYENLRQFLKTRGVDLQDGSYSRGIHAGCSFLADAINLSQAGLTRAKTEIEKQLDNARKIIHEKTAPKGSRTNSNNARRADTARNRGARKRSKTRPRGKGKG